MVFTEYNIWIGIDSLTKREFEVLGLMSNGDSNSGIADKLFIEPRTVERHTGNILSKLGIKEYEGVNSRVLASLMFDRIPKVNTG